MDDLHSLAQQALTGDRLKISARKDARRTLLNLMRQLAAYVQGHCQDNVTKGPFTDYGLPSSTRTVIEGLAPGAAGSSDWSNVVSRMVI